MATGPRLVRSAGWLPIRLMSATPNPPRNRTRSIRWFSSDVGLSRFSAWWAVKPGSGAALALPCVGEPGVDDGLIPRERRIERAVGGDIEIAGHDHRKAGVGGGQEQLVGLRDADRGHDEVEVRRHEAEAVAAHLDVDGRPPARIREGTEEGRHRKLDPELLDLQVRHLELIGLRSARTRMASCRVTRTSNPSALGTWASSPGTIATAT